MASIYGTHKQAKLVIKLMKKNNLPLPAGMTEQDYINKIMLTPMKTVQAYIDKLNASINFDVHTSKASGAQMSYAHNLWVKVGSGKPKPDFGKMTAAEASIFIKECLRVLEQREQMRTSSIENMMMGNFDSIDVSDIQL